MIFHKTTLKNGLRIITTPMESTKAVTVLVLVGTGTKYERKEINGISHFLEHLFFKGTKNRPARGQISKELDRLGAVYNAFTGKEETGFYVKVDSRHFDFTLDILSDILLNPLFPQGEIEKERGAIFEEINMIQDTPMRFIDELWENLLYGNQPAGWMISGTKESMTAIQRNDIVEYFREQYVAKNMVVSIAGDRDDGTTVAKIKKYFQGIKSRNFRRKSKVQESQTKPQITSHFKQTDQTHLVLGVRAFGLFDERKYALLVLANLLGGTMSSRLFSALREKRGWAYYVYALPEHYTDSGYFSCAAGINNQKAREAIRIILKEYQKTMQKKVSPGEIKKAKDNLKGRLYLGLETSDSVAGYIGGQEIFNQKILTPDEVCAKIDKVTADDILMLAKQIFRNNRLNLAMIGPFKDHKKFQSLLKF